MKNSEGTLSKYSDFWENMLVLTSSFAYGLTYKCFLNALSGSYKSIQMYLPVGQINWKEVLTRIKLRHMNYRPEFCFWHLPLCDTIKALSCCQNAWACGLQREACRHHQSIILKALPASDGKQRRKELLGVSRRCWSKVRRCKKLL